MDVSKGIIKSVGLGIRKSELEVQELSSIVTNNLTDGQVNRGGGSGSKEVTMESLLADNNKINYRLGIMSKALDEEKSKTRDYMININNVLDLLAQIAMEKSYPQYMNEITNYVVPPQGSQKPSKLVFGDYQINLAYQIAKKENTSPAAIAKKIAENFPESKVIDQVETAGPGFINIFLSKVFISKEISSLLQNGVKLAPLGGSTKRVLIDFSSPNVAKEMHVGHLRSTIIGESMARVLEYVGYQVLRINHIGDWGTQFGMLIAHLQDVFPNYSSANFSLPISDLQAFYKESKVRFDSDEEFKKRAYSCVVSLQARSPDYIRAWQMICDVSRKEFTKIYEKLDVKIEERGESFYKDLMPPIVAELEEKGFLEFDDGRKVMFPQNGSIPLTVVKSDGGFTYDTSDMAAMKYRIQEDKADWIIITTDAGQATHFHSIIGCAERCGILDRKKIRFDHVCFGVVLGEDRKKFKTRSGDTIKLSDLLEEGLKRAEEKLIEKGRDKVLSKEEFDMAKTSVAYGCIKYADLSHCRTNDYVFSFDKMLDDKGNTAVYLLYAYTRIKSIARKAEVSLDFLLNHSRQTNIVYEHEKEINLAKKLLKFPEVIDRVSNELLINKLCELLYEICTSFSEFYDSCYCIERDSTDKVVKIHYDRLVLCEVTALVLAKGFDLVGINPVTKM